MYRLAHYFATLPENSALCQAISRARLLDQNCDKLTDVQTQRRRTIQKWRSQATFDLSVSGGL